MKYYEMERIGAYQLRCKLEALVVMLMLCGIIAFAEQRTMFIPVEILFFGVMTIALFRNKKLPTFYIMWGVLFLSYGLMSTFWAYNIDAVLVNLKEITQVILIGTCLIIFMNTEDKLNYVLKCFIIGAGVLGLRLVLTTPLAIWGTERLGDSIGYNANMIGMTLGYAALFCMYFYRKNKKLIYLFITALYLIIVLFTGSKKALFLGVGSISMLYLFTIEKKSKIIFTCLLLMFGGWAMYEAIMNIPQLYNVIGSRIEGFISTLNGKVAGNRIDYSTLNRLEMMAKANELFQNRPVFGYGYGNYAIVSRMGIYSHNNYMEILCGGGVVGLLLYYILPLRMLILSLKGWLGGKKEYTLGVVIMLLVFILDIGYVSYYNEVTQIIFAITVCKVLTIKKRIN